MGEANDIEVRGNALEVIERGLSAYAVELSEGTENYYLSGRLVEIMTLLRTTSTYFLTEVMAVSSQHLFNVVTGGIEDETLTLEYLLFSPSTVAIMDIRSALGVKTLLDVPLEQREGVKTALEVSHAIRYIYSQRPDTSSELPPLQGFVTAEVLPVILQHPDREDAILNYVRDRQLVSDEINPDHLTEYLSGTAPLAAGML